ncbi:TM35B protein, partial [Centropus bengalensis]|nr:TM35B protein [Centropus bengalensis]
GAVPPSHGLRAAPLPSCPSQKSEFVRFAEVFPLKEFGFAPEPGRYLEVVGWVEAVAGLLLAFGPQLLQEISNFVLSVVMIGKGRRGWGRPRQEPRAPRSAPRPGAIYTLLVLQEPLAVCAPATLCLGLLLLLNIRGYAAPAKPKSE